jgi:hypothetical protein
VTRTWQLRLFYTKASRIKAARAWLEDVRNRFGDRVAKVAEACLDSFADTAKGERSKLMYVLASDAGFPSLRCISGSQSNRHLALSDMSRAGQDHQASRDRGYEGDEKKAGSETMCHVVQQTNRQWPDDATEIPHRVDERDAGGRAAAA